MAQCYSCRTTLNRSNSSWEHILPSALGGTLKSRRLICETCNKKAGHLVDRALTVFCRPYITQYNILPDRRTPVQKSRAVNLLPPDGNRKNLLIHAAILKILTNFLVWKWKLPLLVESATAAWLYPNTSSLCKVHQAAITDHPGLRPPYHYIEIKASALNKTITGRVELFGELAFEVLLNDSYNGSDQEAAQQFELIQPAQSSNSFN